MKWGKDKQEIFGRRIQTSEKMIKHTKVVMQMHIKLQTHISLEEKSLLNMLIVRKNTEKKELSYTASEIWYNYVFDDYINVTMCFTPLPLPLLGTHSGETFAHVHM